MSQLPSKKIQEQFQQATQALKTGDCKLALRLFEKVKKKWRDDADIGYLEGLAYGKLGNLNSVIKSSNRALKLNPTHYGALCNLANAQIALKDTKRAVSNYSKALEIKPDSPEVLCNYGKALHLLGDYEKAITTLQKALTHNPRHAPAYAELASCYSNTGNTDKAVENYKKSLSENPDQYDAHIGLAKIHMDVDSHDSAEQHFQYALKTETRDKTPYIGLARLENRKGNFEQALKYLEDYTKQTKQPSVEILNVKAGTLEMMHDIESAHEILLQLIKSGKHTAATLHTYANICKKIDKCDHALNLIESYLKKKNISDSEKQTLFFSAANIEEKLHNYDKAFDYYEQANSLTKSQYDNEQYVNTVNNLIKKCSHEALIKSEKPTIESKRFIFIVGMPRSGTTLVEQILSSHPDIHGAGELPYIMNISSKYSNSDSLSIGDFINLPKDKLSNYAEEYIEKTRQINSDSMFITDKLPHNFFNIGLISTILPEAKIIHCKRDPIDTCLSIYFQKFNQGHDYSWSLDHLADYYLQYHRLMQHWDNVIEKPILELSYEDIITDQKQASQKLLEFCGLEWNEQVLEFHNSERKVATASYDQVNKPIYSSSMQRWKNYQSHLAPLTNKLLNLQ